MIDMSNTENTPAKRTRKAAAPKLAEQIAEAVQTGEPITLTVIEGEAPAKPKRVRKSRDADLEFVPGVRHGPLPAKKAPGQEGRRQGHAQRAGTRKAAAKPADVITRLWRTTSPSSGSRSCVPRASPGGPVGHAERRGHHHRARQDLVRQRARAPSCSPASTASADIRPSRPPTIFGWSWALSRVRLDVAWQTPCHSGKHVAIMRT